MSQTHKDQQLLTAEIEDAKAKVTVGAKYRHYKSADKTYEIIGPIISYGAIC